MSPELVGLIGIVFMLVLLFARMWIAFSMAFVGFFGIVYLQNFTQAFNVVATVPYTFIAKYTLTVLPMFILLGNIIAQTGIAADLFYAAHKWIGQLRGGLAMASAVAATILGVVTDSLIAIITLGKTAVPEMKKYSYDDSLAAASIAGGASLASLIPPSVGYIIYGVLTENSIGELFIAGVIPGIVLLGLITLVIFVRAGINPHLAPAGPKTSLKEKVVSLKNVWALMAVVMFIIVGIYLGIFTPTEAGAVGAGASIVIALLIRRLSWKDFRYCLIDTAMMTAFVLLLMMGVSIFMKFVALSKIPFMLGETISQLAVSPYIIFAAIVVLYMVLGMFMDMFACIFLTMPIIYPIVVALGFDPIWFGVVIVLIMEMGFIETPIGLNLIIMSAVTGIPTMTIYRGVWPFLIALLISIIILTIFPQIALWLPSTM